MSDCAECGMLVADREFHPYAFCVWVKAGLDPWETLRWINERQQPFEGATAGRPEDLPVPANADKRYCEMDGG